MASCPSRPFPIGSADRRGSDVISTVCGSETWFHSLVAFELGPSDLFTFRHRKGSFESD